VKKCWNFLKRNWTLLLSLVVGGIGWFLGSRKHGALHSLQIAKAKIDRKAEVKKLVEEKRHEEALQKIELDHRETLEKIDGDLKAKAESLRQNPEALNRWLEKLGEL
jgi:hypothetical protein